MDGKGINQLSKNTIAKFDTWLTEVTEGPKRRIYMVSIEI